MIVKENISLKPFNTFGIDASARYFAAFRNFRELEELLQYSSSTEQSKKAIKPNLQFPLILGGGSNLLLTKDVDRLVLKNEIDGINVVKEDDEFVYLKAGAGVNWHRFVLYCVENGYAGVENLSLIPGNVGASPMQNIGAYGVEIKDVFHELEAVHMKEKGITVFSLEDCNFGYRESVFKNKYKDQFVIVSVTYRLSKNPLFNISYGAISQELEKMGIKELTIQAVSQAVINIRSSKLPDPKLVGNAGSFFKNPVISTKQFEELKRDYPGIVAFPSGNGNMKVAAGWLIEQCGWKGFRRGDAGCYPKQALVLVNYGQASGNQIFELSEEIRKSVKEKFGIGVEREVNVL
jgi:UDP-N-acetylmuramate dehydrogenase